MQQNRTIVDDRGRTVAVYDKARRALLVRQRYWDEGTRKHKTQTIAIPVDALLDDAPITVTTTDYEKHRSVCP